jgi:hypothetical protein
MNATNPVTDPRFADDYRPSLRSRLTQPVDIAGIVVFRIVFGAVMLWEVGRYLAYGWVRAYYIDPPFHFTYWGFGWVQPLPGDWMYALFAVLGALALAIALGVAYRLSIVLFTLGFTYWFLLEQTRYQNHFYLIALLGLILCLIPAGGACSIDARAKPHRRRATVPAWMLWLLRFQIAVPFVFGALAKITPDWLRGEPMRMWLAESTNFPLIGAYFTQEWVVYLFAYGGIAFDLLIAPLLLCRKTRPWAYAVNLLFHLTNTQLFHIGIFPWFLIGATTIFFDPSWPRRVAGWCVARISHPCACPNHHHAHARIGNPCYESVVNSATANSMTPRPMGRLAASLLGLYVAAQCLIPLWHYRYPGPSAWTMEGHYFAWHMRVAEKVSGIRFYVIDRATAVREAHDPNTVLPRWQVDAMSVSPELVRKYGRQLAQQRASAGTGPVEVRARVVNSLNGREPQLLVDPAVNLAAKDFSWQPADWIVPLRDPLPGKWRPRTGSGGTTAAIASTSTDESSSSER